MAERGFGMRHGRPPVGSPATNPNPVAHSTRAIESTRGRRDNTVLVLAIVGYCVLSLVALVVMVYLLAFLGTGAFIAAGVLALVPLAIVLVGVSWIDRWEPEPPAALIFAFLWGAAASVAMALLFDLGMQVVASIVGIGDGFWSLFFALVVQAPLVEEFGKGFGVLLLFWVIRRQFDGPVDGIVYGAMVAVGFAFTENIQYFGLALSEAQAPGDVAQIFLMRGLMSPFAHVMFTACLGLVMGWASRRASALGMIGWFVVGLVPAVLLHSFWNASALFVTDFISYYFVVQVPLFLVGFAIVFYLRRQERALTRKHLQEYAEAGWFTPQEVVILSTGQGRRAAAAWANSHGIGDAFNRFAHAATRLAFTRHRIVLGRDRHRSQDDERMLLEEVLLARASMEGAPVA